MTILDLKEELKALEAYSMGEMVRKIVDLLLDKLEDLENQTDYLRSLIDNMEKK